MNLAARLLLLCITTAIATACATSPPPLAWYRGKFLANLAEGDNLIEFALACPSDDKCTLQLKQSSGKAPAHVQELSTKPPVAMSAEIPNNNFDIARRAVAGDPDLYQSPRFGPYLVPTRDALASGSRLSDCVDIARESPGSLALCVLNSDRAASNALVLLFPTMNGSCGTLPFCAYYFVPMRRLAGGG